MKILDFPQGSPEWLQARAGKVTASCITDVMAKIKSGEAAARADYRAQIVAEILTGRPQGSTYMNPEMMWGQEQEPYARAAYEMLKETMVDQCGLVVHPFIERAAASPDGLSGDGLLEIKCPKTATHLQYMIAGTVPAKYQPQMLWQMACTQRPWVDFVSFDPRLPDDLQLFCIRFDRDESRIKEMEREVIVFLGEVDDMIAKIRAARA